jgi:hypothetical protein
MIIFPTYDNVDYLQTVVLEGKSYSVWLQWNGRDESWRMALGSSGDDFRCRFKVTNGVDLLAPYRAYEDTPDGVIRCIDVEKYSGRVDKEGLISGRYVLVYLTQDENEILLEG